MEAIIFARVSSKEQEEGQSIPAKVKRLTEYALKKNFKNDNNELVVAKEIFISSKLAE